MVVLDRDTEDERQDQERGNPGDGKSWGDVSQQEGRTWRAGGNIGNYPEAGGSLFSFTG